MVRVRVYHALLVAHGPHEGNQQTYAAQPRVEDHLDDARNLIRVSARARVRMKVEAKG